MVLRMNEKDVFVHLINRNRRSGHDGWVVVIPNADGGEFVCEWSASTTRDEARKHCRWLRDIRAKNGADQPKPEIRKCKAKITLAGG